MLFKKVQIYSGPAFITTRGRESVMGVAMKQTIQYSFLKLVQLIFYLICEQEMIPLVALILVKMA